MTALPDIRLHEGELNIMELLWSNKVLAAKDISKIIKEYVGWEKNTTYTVINRLIQKGAIKREDPGFMCRATISKKTVQAIETKALLEDAFARQAAGTFDKAYLEKSLPKYFSALKPESIEEVKQAMEHFAFTL